MLERVGSLYILKFLLFCPVLKKDLSLIGSVWLSCVALGEGNVVLPSLLMGITKEQRSMESAQSGSENDRVGARSSVSMKTSKRSRSASVSAVRA